MPIRVVIIDDEVVLTKIMVLHFENRPGIEVVGTAHTGMAAISLAKEQTIDVAVVDIRIPGMSGIEITRELLKLQPSMKILGFTGDFVERRVKKMLKAGAQGLLIKGCPTEELCDAIRKVHAGQHYLCNATYTNLFADYIQKLQQENEEPLEKLTIREIEILRLVLEGHSNQDIAQNLHITTTTVEGHRTSIMKKLNMTSLIELTKFGIRVGLISLLE